MNQTSVLLLAVLCVLLTAAGQIVLKIGVAHPSLEGLLAGGKIAEFLIRSAAVPAVMLGLLFYCASAGLWLVVLARTDLSYAFPLVSLGFVFTTTYAHFALHEVVTAGRITGISLIVLGVIFVARS